METVILYTYFETPQTIFNFNFYSQTGIEKSDKVLYVITINGYRCSIDIPDYPNVIVLKRENIGFDFGAHGYALEWLANKNMTFNSYVFINSSVVGPFLPTYYPKTQHWSTIFTSKITDSVKLVGTVISCLSRDDSGGYGPKVAGYCFATDNVGLNILLNHKTIFKNHETKFDAIMAEYGTTTAIINAGYTIDCLMYRYENIDWTDKDNWSIYENVFPDRLDTNDGISIHPFEVVFQKWYWAHHPNNLIFYNYCKKYSDWKLKSIQDKKDGVILKTIPYYPVILNDQSHILANHVINCIKLKKSYIIVKSTNVCPINLEQTTKNINKIVGFENIKIFDANNLSLEILEAKYGLISINCIDVTKQLDKCKEMKLPMNTLFNDPCPGVKKKLYVNYKINDIICDVIIGENYENFQNIFNLKYILDDLFINIISDINNINDKVIFDIISQQIIFK